MNKELLKQAFEAGRDYEYADQFQRPASKPDFEQWYSQLSSEDQEVEVLKQDVNHWHDLFKEHHATVGEEPITGVKFMLGYYSGRKDEALKILKSKGIEP